jgi:hypothetical protein
MPTLLPGLDKLSLAPKISLAQLMNHEPEMRHAMQLRHRIHLLKQLAVVDHELASNLNQPNQSVSLGHLHL